MGKFCPRVDVVRSCLLALILLLCLVRPGMAQSSARPRSLVSIPQELKANPDRSDPEWAAGLDDVIKSATPAEINETVPELMALTEAPNPQLRGEALLVLYGIAMGPSTREGKSNFELMVPYIPRLTPRLMDAYAPNRGMSLLLLGGMAFVRPLPPELIKAAIAVLQDPRSTQLMPDTSSKPPLRNTSSMGAQVLWVLLSAGASFHRDPATGITEGEDSAEVQAAIVTFLRRPDQTSESLSESIRVITIAQPQNTAVNAELIKLLDYPDVAIREALLRHITSLTLTPEDYSYARGRVERIVTNAAEPAELKQLANSILPCWQNDRHMPCGIELPRP
jgi:hypothetical protein